MVPIVVIWRTDPFGRTNEIFSADITGFPATGRPALNLRSVSKDVGRPERDEFRSRRFNTRRDTSVVESLDTNDQYVININASIETNEHIRDYGGGCPQQRLVSGNKVAKGEARARTLEHLITNWGKLRGRRHRLNIRKLTETILAHPKCQNID